MNNPTPTDEALELAGLVLRHNTDTESDSYILSRGCLTIESDRSALRIRLDYFKQLYEALKADNERLVTILKSSSYALQAFVNSPDTYTTAGPRYIGSVVNNMDEALNQHQEVDSA